MLLARGDSLLSQLRGVNEALRKALNAGDRAATTRAYVARGHTLTAQLEATETGLREGDHIAREQKKVNRFILASAEQRRRFCTQANQLLDSEDSPPAPLTESLLGGEIYDQFDLTVSRQTTLEEIHCAAQRVQRGSQQLLSVVTHDEVRINTVLRLNDTHARSANRAEEELCRTASAAPSTLCWTLCLAAVLLSLAVLALCALLLRK